MTELPTKARNATLADLAGLLREQQAAKLDVVAPAAAIRAEGGLLRIDGTDSRPDPDLGMVEASGLFRPTAACDEGIADKLRVPLAYLRRCRADRPDLYDANVNGWLHGSAGRPGDSGGPGQAGGAVGGDPRKFLVRCFRGDGGEGVARAFLSDGFGIIDHLDVLTAALEGVRESGAAVDVEGCDLSERRMTVRVSARAVAALAPSLLAGYRNPFADPDVDARRRHGRLETGRRAAEAEGLGFGPGGEPVVFAGFVISNSEVGDGAFSIVPRLVVQVCRNGLTVARDAMRRVHLGGRLDAGPVRWTDDTLRKNLALVTAQARDAVAAFLDPAYVEAVVAGIEGQASRLLDRPAEQVELVARQVGFSDEHVRGVLDLFVRGGQVTAGGIANAVTAYAQTVTDPDEANRIEGEALRAMELAAALL